MQTSQTIPERRGKRIVKDTLKTLNARYVHYDELLDNAYAAYQDYTTKGKIVDRLGEVIQAIDDYDATETVHA